MATIDKKGNFKGKIGNTVHKKWKDKNVVQSAPGKGNVKQTEATKKAASVFGQVSSFGNLIRDSFKEIIMGYYDTLMIARLTGQLNLNLRKCYNPENKTWTFEEHSLKSLEGFEFNIDSPLKRNLSVNPTYILANNKLSMSFPQINVANDLIFPKNSSSAEITVMYKEYDFDLLAYRFHPVQVYSFEVGKLQTTVAAADYTFEATEGCLCIVSIGVKYHAEYRTSKVLRNNKDLNPAGICCAIFNKGEFILTDKPSWSKLYSKVK